MWLTAKNPDILVCFMLILFSLFIGIRLNFHRLPFLAIQNIKSIGCIRFDAVKPELSESECLFYSKLNSFIWTYEGSGIMKYIQWIATRKLGNIRITRLNDDCKITQKNHFHSNSTNARFVQLYIMSPTINLDDQSVCSMKFKEIAQSVSDRIPHVYFKRKSAIATVLFQQLDLLKERFNLTPSFNISLQKMINKNMNVTNHFPTYFRTVPSINWTVVNSEDLIKTNLVDLEKVFTNFISLLQLNSVSSKLKEIIQYDSHQFTEDATWWDQSSVAENLLKSTIPPRPPDSIYANDFYYLHGDSSFTQYLSDSRQCYNKGIFAQMQSETIINRTMIDPSNRCTQKPFDCAFSDLYSFEDREQIYQRSDNKPLKCGYAIPSILDTARNRYARNHTCETIILTSVINCYDPLPTVEGPISPSFCFVALIDTQTLNAYKNLYSINSSFLWDFIDLGVNTTLFRINPKLSETVRITGLRIFPLAKWIVWLDGKGHMKNISEILKEAKAPVTGARHPTMDRTPAKEVYPTLSRIRAGHSKSEFQINISSIEIQLQESEYQRDGFYSRADALKLSLYDIAIFLYRNNHPCIFRFLCAWHNEVNYYSYRGQLSVYYPAVRFNLTNYLEFLPRPFYHTVAHKAVC